MPTVNFSMPEAKGDLLARLEISHPTHVSIETYLTALDFDRRY